MNYYICLDINFSRSYTIKSPKFWVIRNKYLRLWQEHLRDQSELGCAVFGHS